MAAPCSNACRTPDNVDHHFAIDPSKFGSYAMDCGPHARRNRVASMYAKEVIADSTRDAQNHHPMRFTEAVITLGVAAAHDGAVAEAVAHGSDALDVERRSLPTLIMASSDLANALRHRDDAKVADYLQCLRALTET